MATALDLERRLDPTDTLRMISTPDWDVHHVNPECYRRLLGWVPPTYRNADIERKREIESAGVIVHPVYPGLINGIHSHNAHYILDVGCSEGQSTVEISEAFQDKRVVGIDISPPHLEIAKKKEKLPNLRFVYGNALRLKDYIKERTCAIFAHNSINILAEYFPNSNVPGYFVQSSEQVLDEGGFLVVVGNKGTDYFIAQKRIEDGKEVMVLLDSNPSPSWAKETLGKLWSPHLKVTEEGLRRVGR